MRIIRSCLLAGLAVTGLLSGCTQQETPAGSACEAAKDCDAAAATKGYLCIDGGCTACTADSDCQKVAYYGTSTTCTDGRCTAAAECTPGESGCACLTDSSCNTGLVCDGETSLCRAPSTCTQITCAAHQLCGEATGTQDAHCLPSCETGYTWSATLSSCTPDAATCTPGATGSIYQDCLDLHRECVEDATTAHCGACVTGYALVGDVCALSSCDAADPASIKAQCDAAYRTCVPSSSGASCGDCVDGYVLEGDTCRPLKTCASLGCSFDRCIELAGKDAVCLATADELCSMGAICPPGEAWVPGTATEKGYCRQCAPCDAGPAYTGEIYPVTGGGSCICVPTPGYFFKVGGTAANLSCDADHDGWVRADARDGAYSSECAIRANTKCTVRTIDRFILEGDEGTDPDGVRGDNGPREVFIYDDPVLSALPLVQEAGYVLELYEPDANDDFTVRDDAGLYPTLDVHDSAGSGSGARTPNANELNALTKGCMHGPTTNVSVDYNGNLTPDVEEWHGMPAPAGMPDWLVPFLHYSYYIELYEGYYVAGPNPGDPGAYWISEKSRVRPPLTSQPVALVSGGKYQSCYRRIDENYASVPTTSTPNIGMDFARWSNQTAGGYGAPSLTHSSEFKCVYVSSATPPTDPAERRKSPEVVYASELGSGKLDLNRCLIDANAQTLPLGSTQNGTEWSPGFWCQTVSSVTPDVTTTFAVVRYQDYDGVDTTFQRGCINACVDQVYLPEDKRCPAWDTVGSCTSDPLTGARTGCYYDAGCANCTLTDGVWDCVPKSPDICGGCGQCASTGSDPSAPVWSCVAGTCAGDCGTCVKQSTSDTYECAANPTVCAGGGALCVQCLANPSVASEFNCTAVDSNCPADLPIGDWSTCVYSDVCAETAPDQQRLVTTYTCQLASGSCAATNVYETRACVRETDGVTCADTTVQTSCPYALCANTVSGTVTTTTHTCKIGTCASSTLVTQKTCTRDSTGLTCGSENCGPGGTGRWELCCLNEACSDPCSSCTY